MTYNIYFYSNEGDRTSLGDLVQVLSNFLEESSGEILEDTVGPPVNADKLSADDLVKMILKANVDEDEDFVITVTKKKGRPSVVLIEDNDRSDATILGENISATDSSLFDLGSSLSDPEGDAEFVAQSLFDDLDDARKIAEEKFDILGKLVGMAFSADMDGAESVASSEDSEKIPEAYLDKALDKSKKIWEDLAKDFAESFKESFDDSDEDETDGSESSVVHGDIAGFDLKQMVENDDKHIRHIAQSEAVSAEFRAKSYTDALIENLSERLDRLENRK